MVVFSIKTKQPANLQGLQGRDGAQGPPWPAVPVDGTAAWTSSCCYFKEAVGQASESTVALPIHTVRASVLLLSHNYTVESISNF